MPSPAAASTRRVLVPTQVGGPPLGPLGARQFVRSLGGLTMGTRWQVTLVVHDERALAGHGRAIDALLAKLIDALSNWEPASALSRLNAAAIGDWQSVPQALVEVLAAAKIVHATSGGAFDPTVGRAVARWGFGPRDVVAVDDDAIGYDALELDVDGKRARRLGDVSVDLCGIAKGYAVDRVSRLLVERAVPHHLVEIGGELRGNGVKPDAMPWWVTLECPPDLETDGPIVAALHGVSIATSGDYRRFVRRDGERLAHTIDPRTGRPVDRAPAAVTVLHADCMVADAEATAITVLGTDDGLAYATARGLAARIVSRDPATGIRSTPAFDAMLA